MGYLDKMKGSPGLRATSASLRWTASC